MRLGEQSDKPPPGRAATLMQRIGDAIAMLAVQIAALALAIIVLINGVNVIGRYGFSAPLTWAEEAMVFLMIVTVFFGAIAVAWRNNHIRIDILLDALPESVQRAARIATAAVAVGLLTVVGVASARTVNMLRLFDQRSEALNIPMWMPQGIIALGLFMLAAMIVLRLIAQPPEPPADLGEAAFEPEITR